VPINECNVGPRNNVKVLKWDSNLRLSEGGSDAGLSDEPAAVAQVVLVGVLFELKQRKKTFGVDLMDCSIGRNLRIKLQSYKKCNYGFTYICGFVAFKSQ
jgi:hypothetical protein